MSNPSLLSTDGKYWKTSHNFIVHTAPYLKNEINCVHEQNFPELYSDTSGPHLMHSLITVLLSSEIAHWKSTDILEECVTFIFRAEESAMQETNMK
jgi:hypothetical protein